MDREIGGLPTTRYLWEAKRVVPFLKVDKGLAIEQEGVQLMKPLADLGLLLDRQGVPVKITDPEVIQKVVILLTAGRKPDGRS